MKLIIKNWSKWQTFRNDRPVHFIKLHRDILDDYHFAELSDQNKWKLVSLWCLTDPRTGTIDRPEKEILFKIKSKSLNLNDLQHFVTEWLPDGNQAVTKRLPDGNQSAQNVRLEESKSKRESKSRVELYTGFEKFWDLYPKHRRSNKAGVLKEFEKHSDDVIQILSGLQSLVQSFDWTKDNGQFVPAPMKFLKEKRWIDETDSGTIEDVKKMEGLGL